jgi:CheY-like chemotaxis protein
MGVHFADHDPKDCSFFCDLPILLSSNLDSREGKDKGVNTKVSPSQDRSINKDIHNYYNRTTNRSPKNSLLFPRNEVLPSDVLQHHSGQLALKDASNQRVVELVQSTCVIDKAVDTAHVVHSPQALENNFSLLIVDSQSSTRRWIGRALKSLLQYRSEVDTCTQALRLIELSHTDPYGAQTFDVVVVGHDLHDDWTGPQTVAALRDAGFLGLVVCVLQDNDEFKIHDFTSNGADYVLVQPFTPDQLINVVAGVCVSLSLSLFLFLSLSLSFSFSVCLSSCLCDLIFLVVPQSILMNEFKTRSLKVTMEMTSDIQCACFWYVFVFNALKNMPQMTVRTQNRILHHPQTAFVISYCFCLFVCLLVCCIINRLFCDKFGFDLRWLFDKTMLSYVMNEEVTTMISLFVVVVVLYFTAIRVNPLPTIGLNSTSVQRMRRSNFFPNGPTKVSILCLYLFFIECCCFSWQFSWMLFFPWSCAY